MSLFKAFRFGRLLKQGVAALRQTRVMDIMTKYVVTISPEKSVPEVAAIMIGEDVSALVVEQAGKPAGILTERDFITKVPTTKKALSLKTATMMSCVGKERMVEAVRPETTLLEARRLMRAKRIRKLVVTNKDGLIAGIITQTDLSRFLYDRLAVIARLPDAPALVRNAMSSKIVSAAQNATFAQAKKLMMQKNISALPITHKNEYVGIFTEYDVVAQFYDAGGKLDIPIMGKIMHSPVKAISGDISIFDANMIMLFEKVRRLLVLDGKKVIGIVSQTDLVHACFEYAELLARELEEGRRFTTDDLVPLRRSSSITSEYINEHIRAYTVQ